ncbi:MAG: histidine acid phosphatase [Muribaculaceae bacterium]|nr:histidine acid phosphatase [Muribaculaceae bacterium]
MRKFFIYLLMCVASIGAMAQSELAQQQLAANHNRSGSNHYAYPYPSEQLPQLTPAPAGYEPFFINHYGRHGSRWLTKQSSYDRPVETLEKLQKQHLLTKQGEVLLNDLRKVAMEANGRVGELSDVGAEQHQGIAKRMCENFPQVFSGDARIDARSTIWIRCILSMGYETAEISAFNPRARIFTDASYHDMYYTGWGYGEDTLANPQRKAIRHISDSIFDARIQPKRFISQIVNDSNYLDSHFKQCAKLMEDVYDIAGSLQNHHAFDGMNLFSYFTDEEIYELWKTKNIYWYLQWANSPQGGNRMPFIERALLTNMIETADAAIADHDHHGAALRFGHETCVLPLACLLELDNVNYSCDDLNILHESWRNYEIFPMACNIQMVFYRNGSNDILVKVLFNEHEAKLPFHTDNFPYYRWNDIKPYYQQKLKTSVIWPK